MTNIPEQFRQRQIPPDLGRTGKLISWSRSVVAQEARVMGLVVFEHGDKQVLEIADSEGVELTTGMTVETVWRRLRVGAEGLIEYGMKGRVVQER